MRLDYNGVMKRWDVDGWWGRSQCRFHIGHLRWLHLNDLRRRILNRSMQLLIDRRHLRCLVVLQEDPRHRVIAIHRLLIHRSVVERFLVDRRVRQHRLLVDWRRRLHVLDRLMIVDRRFHVRHARFCQHSGIRWCHLRQVRLGDAQLLLQVGLLWNVRVNVDGGRRVGGHVRSARLLVDGISLRLHHQHRGVSQLLCSRHPACGHLHPSVRAYRWQPYQAWYLGGFRWRIQYAERSLH